MANRKPIPKTQKEIENSLIEPLAGMDDPNKKSKPSRSEELSVRGTKYKPLNIGLEDIDDAVFYYFNHVIQPIVKQNGENINVPVVYGNQERWKSYKKDGYYRDKNGAIMLPIIAITRTNITKDRTVSNKLDANKPNLYTTVSKSYHKGNPYSNFNILNNRIPGETYHVSVIPSYVTIEYECLVQTYYIEQLNKIIEAVEYASDSYWGNPEKFKFRTFVDRFNTTTEIDTEKDRFAKSTFTLRLRGYIIPETLQRDIHDVKIINSKSKIIITTEAVGNINQPQSVPNTIFKPTPSMIIPQWFGYTDATLTYTYDDSNAHLTQFLSSKSDANVVVDIYNSDSYVIFLSSSSNAIIYDINNFVITKAFTKTQISQQISNGTYIPLYQYKTKEPATIGTYKLR